MVKSLWVVPKNDLESQTIIKMLERQGEDVLVTAQGWGASWANLEQDIKNAIQSASISSRMIYGIELQGNVKGAINIDHHKYENEDRSNSKSSIEQVAEILGIDLNSPEYIDECFIAANDKGWIPAMEKLGSELEINEDELKEIITNIRRRERMIKGTTLEQEAQAQKAVEELGNLSQKRYYISLELPHSNTGIVTDMLYGKYDNLLITSDDGETNFYGEAEIVNMLIERFSEGKDENGVSHRWASGDHDNLGYGFWGGNYDLDQETVKVAVQQTIDALRNKRKVIEENQELLIDNI